MARCARTNTPLFSCILGPRPEYLPPDPPEESRSLSQSAFSFQEQLSGPRGNGRVQVLVAPFSVMTTLAVAVPS